MCVGTSTYALCQVVIDFDVAFHLLAAVEAELDLFTVAPLKLYTGTGALFKALAIDHEAILPLDDDSYVEAAEGRGDEGTKTVGARGVGEGFGESDGQHF